MRDHAGLTYYWRDEGNPSLRRQGLHSSTFQLNLNRF